MRGAETMAWSRHQQVARGYLGREIAHWLQFGVIKIFLRAFIAILKK